jgi:Flp pilus assembly protein TadD
MIRSTSLVFALLLTACVAPGSFAQSSQANQSSPSSQSSQSGSSSFTQIQDMNKADSAYARANSAMSSGDVEGALLLYQKAVLAEPQSADLHNDYGTALALKGNWEEASGEYKTATTLKPKDELFHANYARTLMNSSWHTKSIRKTRTSSRLLRMFV